jgi:hypothetical protein
MPLPFSAAGVSTTLRAEEAHQAAPLHREVLGHRHHERIALLRADHGQRDAGIAAGGLDDGLAGPSAPLRSAASITARAMRSLTEPPGLRDSIFT